MALSLNEIKNKLAKIEKNDVPKTEVAEIPSIEVNKQDLAQELEVAMDKISKFETKRPWESFEVNELVTDLRAQKAVKKAQIIKERNELLALELRQRALHFEKNPEEFFNQ